MRTLIFDFDGTLADTEDVILYTLKNTLQYFANIPKSDEDIKPLIGLPLKEIFSKASGNDNQDFLSDCVNKYRKDFNGNCQNRVKLYPGVKKTLDQLLKEEKKLAIASNRGKESLFFLIHLLNLQDYFKIILGEEDTKNQKPSPEMVLTILNRLNETPENALMAGDTIYDMLAGKNAGVKTCAASYGNQTEEKLKKASPDYIIRRFPDLLKIVN